MRYATQEEAKGNIGYIARKIITKTGSKQSQMFGVIKCHLFGQRNKWVEDIKIHHNLRNYMRKRHNSN